MTVDVEVSVGIVQTISKITATIYLTLNENMFHHLTQAVTILVSTLIFYALRQLMACHILQNLTQEVAQLGLTLPLLQYQKQMSLQTQTWFK